MSNESTASGGVGLGGLLFVLFLGLKLTDHIDWSWWWVTSPLWIPWVIIIGLFLLMLPFALLGGGSFDIRWGRRK